MSVTVTTLDKKPICCTHRHCLARNRSTMRFSPIHPSTAVTLPENWHLMMLGRQFSQRELSASTLLQARPWKERFANAHDEVYELILHKNSIERTISLTRNREKNGSKKARAYWSLAEQIRSFLDAYKGFTWADTSKAYGLLWKREDIRIYRCTVPSMATLASRKL